MATPSRASRMSSQFYTSNKADIAKKEAMKGNVHESTMTPEEKKKAMLELMAKLKQ